MASTTFLLGLTALVAFKVVAHLTVDAGHFEDLPRPTQID